MAAQTSTTRWVPLLLVAVWLAGCGAEPATEPAAEPASAAASPVPAESAESVADPPRPSPRVPPASARENGGGPNAGTPLRIPLPQDRLTSLKLPEAVEKLEGRIVTACGGDLCVAVLVQATQVEPPEPGQSCDDVEGLVGVDEDDLGGPYFDAVAGGSVTLLTNIRCEDIPTADSSGNAEPSWEQPTPDGGESPEAPEGNLGTPTAPNDGSEGTAENWDPQPDETLDSTP